MKLNNLSRLTALLMAVLLCSIPCASAATAYDFGDITYDTLIRMDAAAAMLDKGFCSVCVAELTNVGITTWPAPFDDCLHTYLAKLSPSEAYDMLYHLYDTKDWLYDAYIDSHEAHIGTATEEFRREPVICTCGYAVIQPGNENHSETCPWRDAAYISPITTTHNVSTADALAGLTKIELTFPAAEGNLTYTWQSSATPDVENSWTNIATGNAYELQITKEALTTAYRCVVSDGTTSSPLYLGGKTFFAWLGSTQDNTLISDWMLLENNKLEYILAAHAAFLKGIPLKEAIHVTADATTLLELFGLTTLAEIDAEGRVMDVRYHIQVAVYSNGVLTPYTLQ